jgi:hypothetical protein
MKTKQPWIMSFALMMGAAGASGQVVPSYRKPPYIGFYGMATFQQPNFSDMTASPARQPIAPPFGTQYSRPRSDRSGEKPSGSAAMTVDN